MNASVPPFLSFFREVLLLIPLLSRMKVLRLRFVFLRIVVCYYNVYLIVIAACGKALSSLTVCEIRAETRVILRTVGLGTVGLLLLVF